MLPGSGITLQLIWTYNHKNPHYNPAIKKESQGAQMLKSKMNECLSDSLSKPDLYEVEGGSWKSQESRILELKSEKNSCRSW